MPPVKAELVERVPDEGQWFERGTRVDFSRLRALVTGAWSRQRSDRTRCCGVRALSQMELAGSTSRCDHSA